MAQRKQTNMRVLVGLTATSPKLRSKLWWVVAYVCAVLCLTNKRVAAAGGKWTFLVYEVADNDLVGRYKQLAWLKAPRLNASNRSMKTPVSRVFQAAGFNWELAPLPPGVLRAGRSERDGRGT